MTYRIIWVAAVFAVSGCGTGADNKTSANIAGAAPGGSAGMHAGGSAGNSGASAGAGAGTNAGGADTAGGGTNATSGSGGSGNPPATHCGTDQPFGTPKLIAELSTGAHEAGARLTSDELTIVFYCPSGALTEQRICLAKRATRTGTFELQEPIVADDGGVPWISDDLRTLFFENTRRNEGVFISQRATADAPFTDTSAMGPPFDSLGDPYVVGGANGHLYLSDRGEPVVSTLQAWLPSSPEPVPLGASDAAPQGRPVPTPDELTLYFVGSPPLDAPTRELDTWMIERKSASDPFGPSVNVAEVNTHAYTFPSWISPDGCRLYVDAGDVAVQRDLYVAERK